jgi:hypothetical protein
MAVYDFCPSGLGYGLPRLPHPAGGSSPVSGLAAGHSWGSTRARRIRLLIRPFDS